MEVRDPIEITDLQTLRERIDRGGVFTVTRGPFAVPTAHQPNCFHVRRIRLHRHYRYWWTPDFSTAQLTLGARRCGHCHW